MQKKITILVVEPNKPAYVKTIDHTLEALQAEVGGLIEPVYAFDDTAAILCNEEGKLKGLPRNRGLFDSNGNLYDILQGTFIVVGIDNADFVSLTEEQIERYKALYRAPVKWVKWGRSIMMITDEPPTEKDNHTEMVPKDHDFYVYPHSIAYAVMNNEVKEYEKSMRQNEKCATEIDLAIQQNYDIDHWCLKKECVFPVLKKFGYDRICWVLVYYIQKHPSDGRISTENRDWANTYPILSKLVYDADIYISSHIGLVDLFATILRRKAAEVKQLSVDIQYYATRYIPDFEDELKVLLNDVKANHLEEMIMSQKTDQLCSFLQRFIDDRSKDHAVPEHTVDAAKVLLCRILKAVHIPGTVLKLVSKFGMDFAFWRVTNRHPDELKEILEHLFSDTDEDGISTEDLTEKLKVTRCTVETIGCSEDYFSPNFPADLEFCWDTMRITDLREKPGLKNNGGME